MTKKSLSLLTATLLLTPSLYAQETLAPITIVSANKTPQSIADTTANVSVITSEEIEEKGYQSVAQAIATQAGIQVAPAGGLGQQTSFFVRGADSGKVLLLIDGMRLNDPSTTNGTALIENLPTSNIEQIEIIKGGSSSIWGSNASAGVINIITKTPRDGLHGSLALSYGSYRTKGADADIAYKDEKFNAQILASYLDTDGFSAQSPRSAEADGYENRNLNLKAGYHFNPKNSIQITYNEINNDIEYDTSSADDNNSTIENKQKNLSLEYRYSSDNYSARLRANKGNYNRKAIDADDGVNTYESEVKELSFLNIFTHSFGQSILGAEYKNIDGINQYNSPFFNSIADADYSSKALFVSNLYRVERDTLVEMNLRYDNFDIFDNKITYKLGLKHHATFLEGLVGSANYYTSYDAPSSYQLANPNVGTILEPSYTKGYDVTASYKELFSLTYFNNRVDNSIDYLYDPVTFIGGYENIEGESKFSGLEIESTYSLLNNLLLSANYTYLIDFEKEDGSDLPRRAKQTLNTSLSYYTNSDTYFSVDAQYVGDREEFGESTGNYTLWNVNFGTKITNDIDLNINARNIFDKEYESVYGYATEGASIYAKLKYTF